MEAAIKTVKQFVYFFVFILPAVTSGAQSGDQPIKSPDMEDELLMQWF